jgi:hypothetical protein
MHGTSHAVISHKMHESSVHMIKAFLSNAAILISPLIWIFLGLMSKMHGMENAVDKPMLETMHVFISRLLEDILSKS